MRVLAVDSYGPNMTSIDDLPAARHLDQVRVEVFAQRLLGHFTSSFVTYMVDLGHRTGLFEALHGEPATSAGLAARSGLQERYVREWLGAVVTAGIASYDATTGEYTLPAENAATLCGDTEGNIAPLSMLSGLLARHIPSVAQAFQEGGGVPYANYRPDFTDVMDRLGRATFDSLLVDVIVPLAGELSGRLEEGVRVADIGCGTGHSTNVLARAFPASTFVGYDLAEDAVQAARREADEYGLRNVAFRVQDVAHLPATPPLDAVFAFDAIHDQSDPAGVLARVQDALVPGGTFVMLDIRASSRLENNVGNPVAPMLYGISVLHCLTISLADHGAGLGTAWGHELATRMLADAGFTDTYLYDVPGDPLDVLYVAHKP